MCASAARRGAAQRVIPVRGVMVSGLDHTRRLCGRIQVGRSPASHRPRQSSPAPDPVVFLDPDSRAFSAREHTPRR